MVEVKEFLEENEFLIIYKKALSEELMILDFLEEEELLTSAYNRKCTNLNLKKKIIKKTIKNKMKKMSRKNITLKIKIRNMI